MKAFVFKEKYLSFGHCPFTKLIPQLVIKNGIDTSLPFYKPLSCPRDGCVVLRCLCSLVRAGGVVSSACCLTHSFQQLSKINISFKS